jgi:hypothetical protein
MILRLRQVLATISPALEKALNLSHTGPVLALTYWQTPAVHYRPRWGGGGR